MKTLQRPETKTTQANPGQKTFCEFFAGIGLVREGLAAKGWECVYANDIDPKKQQAYEARFGRSEHFHLGDVWKTEEVVERIQGSPILMTASFPCIDLSLAGHYRGLEGEHSSTFFGFAKVLDAMTDRLPPLVMLENVNGFLSSNKGQDFATIIRRLADLGYWIDAFVLDACHFTPQSRPRVFVVGISPEHKPKEEPQRGFLWADDQPSALRTEPIIEFKRKLELSTGWVTLPLPDPPKRRATLAEMIDIDDEQEWWNDAEVSRHHQIMSEPHRSRVDEILASKNRWISTIFRRNRNNAMRAEVRFDGLAGCLRTPKGGSAKQIVIVADNGKLRMRWMSPREYARLQGVPDFPLVGKPIQQYWGFADAVCVPAIAWIDRHVLTPLFESVAHARRNGG
jgi:DNA (cytosine-5)-methyltransferase 1